MGSFAWAGLALGLLTAAPELSVGKPASDSAGCGCRCTGDRWRASSANFAVASYHSGHDARQMAELCEQWRQKLSRYWGLESSEDWRPACQIIVHRDAQSYLAAVGNGAWQTFGSSELVFGAGQRIVRRRIDLRGDSPHGLAALPHEMTHLIAADLLGGRQPPRWADEGMAILADSPEKQRLHEQDLVEAVSRRSAFRLVDLLALEHHYPPPHRIAAFYGQSASLTAFLVQRAQPGGFIRFLNLARAQGYDRAAQEVFGVSGLAELEQQWQAARQQGQVAGQVALQ